ncbi:MAG: DNA recombination protein RmuC [Rhodospirillaceae bacterium]|nr:DNA recombination protein RmuC [Rhodospirillaceae bacterium]
MTLGLGDALGIFAVFAVIAGGLAWMVIRRSAVSDPLLGELVGRLAQMAESQAAQQAQLAERMQGQERALAKALDERLGEVTRRVGEGLQVSSEKTAATLHDLRERLAVIDAAQKNLTELSTQVVGLQDILSNKQARGAFGEVQMHDIVTAALPGEAFAFQAVLSNSRRADCLLLLPNPPGSIVIDAKFPLDGYQAFRDAEGDGPRKVAAKRFADDVLKHIHDIADRYIIPGETAESALMFLPSEAVYAEIHASFRNVVEESYRSRVWIVSPTTLMATLNTVRAVLKDVQMRKQAGRIQKEVGTLLADVGRLDERLKKLFIHINQAQGDIAPVETSITKIVSRAEKIEAVQLGAPDAADIAHAPPEAWPRWSRFRLGSGWSQGEPCWPWQLGGVGACAAPWVRVA